jgi:hypothetical protein
MYRNSTISTLVSASWRILAKEIAYIDKAEMMLTARKIGSQRYSITYLTLDCSSLIMCVARETVLIYTLPGTDSRSPRRGIASEKRKEHQFAPGITWYKLTL